jgi:hypothetical protein
MRSFRRMIRRDGYELRNYCLTGSSKLTFSVVEVDARTELVIASDIAARLHLSRARLGSGDPL